jgi:ribonuclease HII
MDNTLIESSIMQRGFRLLAGIDEAGRGPLAGPVVAAAVILPVGIDLPGVRDSKQLTPGQREAHNETILSKAVAVGVGCVDAPTIDRINILQATLQAMVQAVRNLGLEPDFLLIDGPCRLRIDIPQEAIPKGDQLCLSISAASIVAKVHRDRLMAAYHREYPGYGFDRHKGYGTAEHLSALRRLGPCCIHRMSFHGVCSPRGEVVAG